MSSDPQKADKRNLFLSPQLWIIPRWCLGPSELFSGHEDSGIWAP